MFSCVSNMAILSPVTYRGSFQCCPMVTRRSTLSSTHCTSELTLDIFVELLASVWVIKRQTCLCYLHGFLCSGRVNWVSSSTTIVVLAFFLGGPLDPLIALAVVVVVWTGFYLLVGPIPLGIDGRGKGICLPMVIAKAGAHGTPSPSLRNTPRAFP